MRIKKKATTWISSSCFGNLSGYCDSNTGPSGPKPDALTNCATPRLLFPSHLGLQIYDSFLKLQNFFCKIFTFCTLHALLVPFILKTNEVSVLYKHLTDNNLHNTPAVKLQQEEQTNNWQPTSYTARKTKFPSDRSLKGIYYKRSTD